MEYVERAEHLILLSFVQTITVDKEPSTNCSSSIACRLEDRNVESTEIGRELGVDFELVQP